MELKKSNYYSIQDYLAFESESEFKHEYEKGLILAMSGGSINHGTLCGNIYAEVRKGLNNNESDCKVFGSEIKVHIETSESFVYPDAMVICGDIEISKDDKNAITNPKLIVEVLSKSTANYDRGDKFYKYRELASFREYLLINQDKAVIDIFYKNEDDNKWEIDRKLGLDSNFELRSIDVRISIRELYKNVTI